MDLSHAAYGALKYLNTNNDNLLFGPLGPFKCKIESIFFNLISSNDLTIAILF